jgi:hypothetical protein
MKLIAISFDIVSQQFEQGGDTLSAADAHRHNGSTNLTSPRLE